MTTHERVKNLPLALTWAACLWGLTGGCDEASEAADEALAGAGDQEREPLHPGDVEASAEARVEAPEHDDGCFGGYRLPVTVEWAAGAGDSPEIAVDFEVDGEQWDRVTLQFHVVPLPTGLAAARTAGPPVALRGDARVAMPDALVAAMRTGDAYVAFAIFTGCQVGDSDGECLIRNSGEIYIEDGRVFLPADYQVYMREKWAATRPWLFEDGVVTGVIDMKGL